MTSMTARTPYAVNYDARPCIDADMRALADHMHRCGCSQDRWFSLHCLAEKLRAFTGPRFMSMVVLSALIVGGLCFVG